MRPCSRPIATVAIHLQTVTAGRARSEYAEAFQYLDVDAVVFGTSSCVMNTKTPVPISV